MVIKNMQGRQEDFLITPWGNVIGRLDHVFKVELREAQFVQLAGGCFDVRILPRGRYWERVGDRMITELKNRLGLRRVPCGDL